MSNWWKRFFGLSDDEDLAESSDRDRPNNRPQEMNSSLPTTKGRFEDPGRRLEVKMVNQYPTTQKRRNDYSHKMPKRPYPQHSRFSDSYDEPAYLRKSQHSMQHQSMEHRIKQNEPSERLRGSRQVYQQQLRENKNNEKTIEKKKQPFRPTSVPSPIFGYQQRKEYTQPPVEPEISPLLETNEDISSLPVQHTEELFSAETYPESIPESISDQTIEEVQAVAFDEVESGIVLDTEPQEEHFVQEENNHSLQEEILETENEIEIQETVEHKNPAIPYNVLMFGADRHALRQKQLQTAVPASESFPGNQMKTPNDTPSMNNRHNTVSMETADTTMHSTQQMGQPMLEGEPLPIGLFQDPPRNLTDDVAWISEKQEVLKQVLKNFHVHADIVSHVQGPTVTRFEIRLHPGVKVSKVIGLTEDIKLSMAAEQIRIAPVAGKSTVGIEIPNEKRKPVYLKTLLESESFRNSTAPLTAALGIDISGSEVVTDLSKMPHGLIAGATGSGKSVCIHSLILSLIYKSNPNELRLVLIDPKVVELAMYQRLPHLAAPVINQPKDAALALRWAVEEMERRYQAFADIGVRDIKKYNQNVGPDEKWPYIVIIIDELADLMMVSPQDVEESICRIAQKARAAGIHLLLATQRPSVDVITGLIKANIPTRIAFGVSAQADSRTILDSGGAERLLGQGDMLFAENGSRDIQRLQGAFVSDEEIDRVTDFLASWPTLPYLFDPAELREQRQMMDDEDDELYLDAANFVIEQGQASVSSLQRRFRIGYNRAARLIDCLEANDVISEANGSKPRQVLMTKEMLVGNEFE